MSAQLCEGGKVQAQLCLARSILNCVADLFDITAHALNCVAGRKHKRHQAEADDFFPVFHETLQQNSWSECRIGLDR